MNCQARSLLISFGLHLGVIFLAFTLDSSFAHFAKPVVIDFTLMDNKGSAPEKPQKTYKPPAREPVRNRDNQKRTATVAERPRVVSAPIPASSQPSTSTEPQRVVPVSAPEQRYPGNVTAQTAPVSGGNGSGTGRGQAAGPGTGNSAETMRNRYLREHFEYIRTLIQRNLSYPARAQRMGWTGKVVVSFTILENGYTVNTRILSSSGYDLLDENVLNTIKTAEPFPKPPVKAEIKIPITYRLDY
jgi:protein TonB